MSDSAPDVDELIVALGAAPDIKELKEKIREVVSDFLNLHKDIHISVVYYEVNSYKKPLKVKK